MRIFVDLDRWAYNWWKEPIETQNALGLNLLFAGCVKQTGSKGSAIQHPTGIVRHRQAS